MAGRSKAGPKRSVSFRLEPPTAQQQQAEAAAADVADVFADDASVCSAATMATWVSGSTQCTGTSCSSDANGSVTEAERLFNMTGAQ
jgi:hypothetical protein